MISSVCEPLKFKGQTLTVGCSIGAAVYPRQASKFDQLLKYANHAMYAAKNKGKGIFCIYVVEDRAPRVYPWVNERDGGILYA